MIRIFGQNYPHILHKIQLHKIVDPGHDIEIYENQLEQANNKQESNFNEIRYFRILSNGNNIIADNNQTESFSETNLRF